MLRPTPLGCNRIWSDVPHAMFVGMREQEDVELPVIPFASAPGCAARDRFASAQASALSRQDVTADSEWLFERDSSAAPLPRYRERNDYGAHSIARFTNALSRTE